MHKNLLLSLKCTAVLQLKFIGHFLPLTRVLNSLHVIYHCSSCSFMLTFLQLSLFNYIYACCMHNVIKALSCQKSDFMHVLQLLSSSHMSRIPIIKCLVLYIIQNTKQIIVFFIFSTLLVRHWSYL